MKVTSHDATQRAYGILWREPSPSLFSTTARKELLDALTHEERRAGIAWAMEQFGPMSDSEMIAADIRAGVFPKKSTEMECPHNPCACVDAGITTGAATCDFVGHPLAASECRNEESK